MTHRAGWLSLLAAGLLFHAGAGVSAQVPLSMAYQQYIEGPVPAEVDPTAVAADCFYTDNRQLAQCLTLATMREAASPAIEGLVPAEEDRTRLAVDCFYTENRAHLPCN